MSVGPLGSHDIRLEDRQTSPTITLDLVLARDENGAPIWQESRAPIFPPRGSDGPISFVTKDPLTDFVWEQDDWSGGALEPYYRIDVPNHYATADDVDLRWKGVAAMGMELSIDNEFAVVDGGAERSASTSWTPGTGIVYTKNTTTVRSGLRSHQCVGSTLVGDASILSQNLTSVNTNQVVRNHQFRVIAYVRRTAGTNSGIKLQVRTNVAGNSATSAAVTADAWTYVTAQITGDATATSLTFDFLTNGAMSSVSHTFLIDDVALFPTGGVTCNGVAERANILYGAFGRCVTILSGNTWTLDYVHDTVVTTDIVAYLGTIFVAFGASNAYIYGSSAAWIVGALAGNNSRAIYFAVTGNHIVKSEDANTIRIANAINQIDNSATTPWQQTDFEASYDVGGTDHAITRLFSFAGTFFVGKSDGLWQYTRFVDANVTTDSFTPVTDEWQVMTHTDNFARGTEWHGWLYLTASQQSFFRFDGTKFENLSSLFVAPRLTDFGGRVRALVGDPHQLWVLLDTSTADATATKTTRLLALHEDASKKWHVHVMSTVDIGDINRLAIYAGRIYAIGRAYNADLADYVAAIKDWALPTNFIAPYADLTPTIAPSGTFDTSIWHGGVLEEQKAFLSLTIWTANNLDANHTIRVDYGLDGAAPNTTNLPNASGGVLTFNSAGRIQTVYFNVVSAPETNAIGRTIQFRFTLASNNTVSPELYGFALHSTLRVQRIRSWTCVVRIGRGVIINDATGFGTVDPRSKIAMLNDLNTLETQVYPIYLTHDLDGDGTTTSLRVHLIGLRRFPTEAEPVEGEELYELTLQEAVTSA